MESDTSAPEQADEAAGNFPIILVPLDGSMYAEQALLPATSLARAHGSTVLLTYVTPLLTWAFSAPGSFATPEMYAELLAAEDRDAHTYLAHIAARLEASGVHAQTLAVRGFPAATLIDLIQQSPVDLVVMTTHGRTGLERFALGSVADRLVREGTAPVLLLRTFDSLAPTEPGAINRRRDDGQELPLSRAHIPLDGSALAESAFEVATKLAGAPLREIVLVRVVMAGTGSRVADEAWDYLVEAGLRLSSKLPPGVCTISMRVLFGTAAEAICDEARKDADVVIMATHGMTGVRRWMVGSVADQILHDLPVPLLLVRAFAQGVVPPTLVTQAEEKQ